MTAESWFTYSVIKSSLPLNTLSMHSCLGAIHKGRPKKFRVSDPLPFAQILGYIHATSLTTMYAFGLTPPPPLCGHPLCMVLMDTSRIAFRIQCISMSEIILLVRGQVKKGEAKKVTKFELHPAIFGGFLSYGSTQSLKTTEIGWIHKLFNQFFGFTFWFWWHNLLFILRCKLKQIVHHNLYR